MNDGDWICSDSNCGNINFARRNTCYRCNKERPDGVKPLKKKLGTEIGKSAAEKSRGLFNADDWQCNKCANVNWARRQTCNVCNAPKFGEVEARTGYGGGYNERGVVEYRKREASSDDEYDEFGRKKRKRKQEAEDKVGITEGPVSKKFPPSMRASKEDLKLEPSSIPNSKREQVHVNGSLSDGSICDVPPLTKVAFRRHQLQTQTSYHRQNHMLPNFKANGIQARKRFSSSGERDNIGSSGYETCSKISNNKKFSPIGKPNPVMENRVSSTNNDLVTFKFTGSTPAEDFQVTYSLEERVRVAAYAIVYNNCKLSTDKFEALYDKPAPDFKTIFAWRQRLLSTGCLVDSHLDTKKDTEKPALCPSPVKNCEKNNHLKLNNNPDEIPIISDTDDSVKNANCKNKSLKRSSRSDSIETLLIGGIGNNNKPCSAVGTTEDRIMKNRSISECTPLRTRSSSRDSQDSNYPDSDSEKMVQQNVISLNTSKVTALDKKGLSTQDSDSDSISYNSDDVEFLSRSYGDDKRKCNAKNRHHSNNKVNTFMENTPNFQGYTTLTPLEQSTLITANIYTPGLTNMNVKNHDNALLDTDGCSSEYVPTRVGSSTKKNYQEFKDNVMKKGFWAKGDGSSFKKNRQTYKESRHNVSTEKSIIRLDYEKPLDTSVLTDKFRDEIPIAKGKQGEDFTNDDFDGFIATEQYTCFDKPFLPGLNLQTKTENTSRIFEVVQSDSALKGKKSIMDIFSNNDQNLGSPEASETHTENILSKSYEEWNEDDDALYNDVDTNMLNVQEQSMLENSNIQYEVQLSDQVPKTEFLNKNDQLMELLKTFQTKQISDNSKLDIASAPSQVPQFQDTNSGLCFLDTFHQHTVTNDDGVSEKNKSNAVNSSKKIHIIDSVTIKPSINSNAKTDIKKPQEREFFTSSPNIVNQTKMPISSLEPKISETGNLSNELSALKPQIDITNLLSGINTNTLLLALQNLKNLKTSAHNTSQDISSINDDVDEAATRHDADHLETINLTNDEDWEKETVRDGSIERELEKLDGNTGDTPFLGDMFDPSPVIPFNVPKKLNINLKNHETCDTDKHKSHLNDNAPVIGNFKSFALPKPVLLNRLKLTVKVPDKTFKRPTEGKKTRRKKKNKTSASQEEEGDGDEEDESGDEADLSKYDLWGSDEEKGKTENTEQAKEGESSKDGGAELADNNDKTPVENKVSKRSRSSSSSSSSTSSSSSSHSSGESPKNKFDDFNLNSERESVQGSPKGRRSRSRSPRSRSQPARRKSRDSRSAGETRTNDSSREKEKSRERERRDRSRGARGDRKERRYSREGPAPRVRHR